MRTSEKSQTRSKVALKPIEYKLSTVKQPKAKAMVDMMFVPGGLVTKNEPALHKRKGSTATAHKKFITSSEKPTTLK